MKKGLKQKIATVLIVAMTAGMTAGPAWADETPTRKWVQDGGFWYYYDDQGEMVKNREKYINKKWYGFNEEGVMYSNELFVPRDQRMDSIMEVEEGEELEPDRLYAFPAGNLVANGWVKLNGEGKLYTNDDVGDPAYWYYFKDGDSNDKLPSMVRGEERKIQGAVYRFDKNGVMYQSEWYREYQAGVDAEGNSSEGEYGIFYYGADGPKAMNKWLPLDGYWYRFDNNGEVREVAYMASPSDASEDPVVGPWQYETISDKAPARQVHSISVASGSNTEVEVPLGESVKLKFQITLASDSNAKVQNFDDFVDFHDFVPGNHVAGRFYTNKAKIDKNGVCTVEYKPKNLGGEAVTLRIDGIGMDDEFWVEAVAPEDISQKKDAVDTLLNDAVGDGEDSSATRDAILEILDSSEDSDKKELQQTIVRSSNYALLDSNYAMENAIEVRPANIAEEAQSLLSGGEISLVGGALNAEAQDVVELRVAPSAEVPVLAQEFANKVSFDIKLAIGDDEPSELNFPIKITMPVPVGFSAESMRLFHIHNGVETELNFTVNNGMITFTVAGFSDFVFVQDDTKDDDENHGGGSGGSGGGGGGSSSAGGVITTDSKKGRVNSLTGIIIGSGDGYSKWVQETIQGQETTGRWRLQYADGTYAAGGYVLDEQGNPVKDSAGNQIEQPLWEMISGVWYAFGADGYAKSGMVFDPAQNGWFYIDINTGMKTGWQQIDGKWYYFNPTSDGSRGIMYVSRTTPDGYEVGADGVWMGQ